MLDITHPFVSTDTKVAFKTDDDMFAVVNDVSSAWVAGKRFNVSLTNDLSEATLCKASSWMYYRKAIADSIHAFKMVEIEETIIRRLL